MGRFILPVILMVSLNTHGDSNFPEGFTCDRQSIMTLSWTICVYDVNKNEDTLKKAISEGMTEVHRIDEWMSEWKPNSVVTQINNSAGIKPVSVTPEAMEAIDKSLQHAELTGGAYDISFNAFFGLYSWKQGQERFPTDEEIRRILPLVNYRNVSIDKKKSTVFLKNKGMKIGLGGMGEGWTVDKVYDVLQKYKITSGYIDGSGAVRMWGKKPGGKLWTVGITNPRPVTAIEKSKPLYNMYMTDVAITTSGDTEKFFVRDGKRYHHIIDPKTGYSADQSVQVTAICPTATLCDLVDTGMFIIGPEKALEYAKKVGVEAIIFDKDLKMHLTPGIRKVQTAWGPSLELVKSQ